MRSIRSDSGAGILRWLIQGVGLIENKFCAKTPIRNEKRHGRRELPRTPVWREGTGLQSQCLPVTKEPRCEGR